MTADTNIVNLPGRLSYSSLSSYSECGERWRLERLHKLKGGTWWATVAGTAVHHLTEEWDRGNVTELDVLLAMFPAELDKAAAAALERDGEVKPSGSVLKKHGATGGPNKKDRDWWLIEGPKMLTAYVEWRQLSRWTIPTLPDGRLAIEVPVPVPFAGRDQLGFIDRVFMTPRGELIIVDLKTGKEPDSTLQLGHYGVALERTYGLTAEWGYYWMGSTGELAKRTDLTAYSEEYVDHLFEMAWTGIEAGVFLPNVTNMCKGCGVRDYCRAVKGSKSGSVPVVDLLMPAVRPGASV